MDDPALDAQHHLHALAGLCRINWWSRSADILWPPIQAWLRRHGRRHARLFDVATGGGDVPVALWKRAQRAGFSLEITGCDFSARAVAQAQRHAARANAPVRFMEHDAVGEPLPSGYDIVTSSLFFHHLEQERALALLRRMARAAEGLVLVNDLIRSARGVALAYVGTRLLTRSPVVHTDSIRSVRAAFTVEEMRALAQEAGLSGAIITRRWPCRFLLAWSKP